MNCEKCGMELSTFDYGWYCSNKECEMFDEEIYAYEWAVKESKGC